jgi:hypothetical protein
MQTFPFSRPHRKKSDGVESGDLDRQRSFEINSLPPPKKKLFMF